MAETTDGLHCAEALDGGFDAGEEFIESLARLDDVLYDEGGAAQDSQWSSSSRSWGRGDSPSCHPDASFTATSSSYGHSIPSLATSGTNATLWSGESSASHAPDSMRHATQVTAANGDAAAAHNTLTAGLGNSQTNWPASLPLWSGQSSAGHLPHATQFHSCEWRCCGCAQYFDCGAWKLADELPADEFKPRSSDSKPCDKRNECHDAEWSHL